ncbi:hypothetical protein HMPREF1574_00765 [Gardnerella pickettii JCP7659]|nr:hypothetical protein HMPREF1574_00765 [Gardnerella pickettii JCP7659]
MNPWYEIYLRFRFSHICNAPLRHAECCIGRIYCIIEDWRVFGCAK